MNKTARRLRHILYGISFFFSIHLAITAYINSSFMERIVGQTQTGILYTIAAVFGIATVFYMPKILKEVGAGIASIGMACVHILSIYWLIVSDIPSVIVLAFVLYLVSNSAIIYLLDIFLQTETDQKDVGGIRGTYLTITNLAWVMSPLVAGAILTASGYSMLYIIGLVAMLPVFFLLILVTRHFKDPKYKIFSVKKVLTETYKKRDIGRIWIANFALQFFYVWMVIYTPIYLHQNMGIGWGDIGIIFTIMLLPFVIIQYPLGKVADRKFGEKELLLAGFAIMGAATYVMSTIQSNSVLVWGTILFITRIGASMIEVMSETYFFKQVKPDDSDLIGFFRNAAPMAYVVAPLVATLLLFVIPINLLFVVLSIVALAGFSAGARIKDTL